MPPQPPLRGVDLFREIIHGFRRQPDPTAGLTLRQIANLTLRIGNEQNAGIVGRTISEFDKYFKSQGQYKVSVNWRLIEEEHPDLLSRPKLATISQVSPVTEMLAALNDEYAAVREQIRQRPLTASLIGEVSRFPDSSFLYEAEVAIPADAEVPIPEGVGMKVVWANPYFELVSTLLAYDAVRCRMIFEVSQEIPSARQLQNFRIYPAVDQLIVAVRDRLKLVADRSEQLPFRLLTREVTRLDPVATAVLASSLDASQVESIRRCLTQDATFLWGPPGTGKTHTLAHLLADLAIAGRRVVAVSIANVAVDQLAQRLVAVLNTRGQVGLKLLNDGRVVRFGYARLPEVTGEPRLFPNRQEIQELRRALHAAQVQYRKLAEKETAARALQQKEINDLKQRLRDVTKTSLERANVVLTTAVQTCLEPEFALASFDVTVIDEASMMPIPFAVCAAALARRSAVVAGDFRQLGPIALAKSERALKWLHRDGFAAAGIGGDSPQHPGLTMLNVQRRMHHDIREMINPAFYSRRLSGEASPEKLRMTGRPPMPGAAVLLIKVTAKDGSEVLSTEGHSRTNPLTARIVAKIVRALARRESQINIGVLAPYRAQVGAIKRLVRDANLPHGAHERIKIGTVHAFQGAEADVVVWDLVDAPNMPVGRLYYGEMGNRLANVAISRAQGKLIVVGDPDVFFEARGHEMVKAMKSILFHTFGGGRNTMTATEAIAWSDDRPNRA